MNAEEDLDLEIEPDELAKEDAHEAIDESDDLSVATSEVVRIISTNIFDNDLENSLVTAIQKYFDGLRAKPRIGADIYGIPDLNQTVWDTFHNYEDFVHENRFENINLTELGNIIRSKVTPVITEYLHNRIIAKSQREI